jgi:hypothetical protein
MGHLSPKVTRRKDRKQNRNDWNFSEWGNFHADALCDIIMPHQIPTPIAPWKLESVVLWSCSFADNGDRIAGSALSFVLHTRARTVTGKTSAVITECRCAVAKVRHERAAKEGAEAAKRRQEQLEGKGGT